MGKISLSLASEGVENAEKVSAGAYTHEREERGGGSCHRKWKFEKDLLKGY